MSPNTRAKIQEANDLLDQALSQEFMLMSLADSEDEADIETRTEALSTRNKAVNRAKDILGELLAQG